MIQILMTELDVKKQKKTAHLFKWQFIISIFMIVLCVSYYAYFSYYKSSNDKIAQKLMDNFNIIRLYADNSNYETTRTENTNSEAPITTIVDNDKFSILGIIKIQKLQMDYPILSETSTELLKISPTKFYGPNLNEIGNLCITAHNYVDNRFFSNIFHLNHDDIITIVDLGGRSLNYKIYDIYETNAEDTSVLNQDTNNLKEVTLITCNNVTSKRLIVKAREVPT